MLRPRRRIRVRRQVRVAAFAAVGCAMAFAQVARIAAAQTPQVNRKSSFCTSWPKPEDWPAPEPYTMLLRPPDVRPPDAREFRTVLRAAATRPVDFAAYYTVVTWGCGSNCQVLALIDRRTGRVLFPDLPLALGASYAKESSLLIVNPPEAISEFYNGNLPPPPMRLFFSYFYEWDEANKSMDLVCTDEPNR